MRVLVVDAANVVGSRPDGWWKDRAGAARRLHERLLVADLSFEEDLRDLAKTGVLTGSVLSAIAGALMLGHRDRFHATP